MLCKLPATLETARISHGQHIDTSLFFRFLNAYRMHTAPYDWQRIPERVRPLPLVKRRQSLLGDPKCLRSRPLSAWASEAGLRVSRAERPPEENFRNLVTLESCLLSLFFTWQVQLFFNLNMTIGGNFEINDAVLEGELFDQAFILVCSYADVSSVTPSNSVCCEGHSRREPWLFSVV